MEFKSPEKQEVEHSSECNESFSQEEEGENYKNTRDEIEAIYDLPYVSKNKNVVEMNDEEQVSFKATYCISVHKTFLKLLVEVPASYREQLPTFTVQDCFMISPEQI